MRRPGVEEKAATASGTIDEDRCGVPRFEDQVRFESSVAAHPIPVMHPIDTVRPMIERQAVDSLPGQKYAIIFPRFAKEESKRIIINIGQVERGVQPIFGFALGASFESEAHEARSASRQPERPLAS